MKIMYDWLGASMVPGLVLGYIYLYSQPVFNSMLFKSYDEIFLNETFCVFSKLVVLFLVIPGLFISLVRISSILASSFFLSFVQYSLFFNYPSSIFFTNCVQEFVLEFGKFMFYLKF